MCYDYRLFFQRNLEDREKLTNRVRYMEIRLNEKDDEIKVLHRRLLLESKTYKTQVNAEHLKYKELNHKLEKITLERQNVEVRWTNIILTRCTCVSG